MAARPEKKLPVLPMEVLDDISCRFFNTIPTEELEEDSHIGSQIEMAHWFYLDHTLKQYPSLPRLGISIFSRVLSRHCPILKHSEFGSNFVTIWNEYKRKIPVCGAILVNPTYEKVILVQSMDPKSPWTFPRGKKNRNETPESCAMREVFEETGFNIEEHPNALDLNEYIFDNKGQSITLYFVRNVPEDYVFQPRTECEIGKIEWFDVDSVYSSTAPCFKFIKSTMPKIRKWMIKERQQFQKSVSGAGRNPKSSSSSNTSLQTPSSSSSNVSDRVPSPAPITKQQNGATSPSIMPTDPQIPTTTSSTQKTSSPQTSPLPVPAGQYLPLGFRLPMMSPYLIQPSPTTPYLPNPNPNPNSNLNSNANLAVNNNSGNPQGPLQNSQGNENGSNVLRSSTGTQYTPYQIHPGFYPPHPSPIQYTPGSSPSGLPVGSSTGQNPTFPFGYLPSYPPSYPPPPSFSFVPQTQPALTPPTSSNPTADR